MAVVKFSKQTIEPNPLEVDYWVDVTSDPYGSVWKYYNGIDWVSLNLNDGSDDGLSSFDYYTKEQVNALLSGKADADSVESKVDDAEFANVIQNIEFREIGDNKMEMVLLKYDNATVGVTIPMASETNPGMLSGESFRDFVKQSQLQQLYNDLYLIVSLIIPNTPDEEDITAEGNLLKLKNRDNVDGMGYVILRKNKSFKEQLTQTNTIYEVRYEFNLNGEEVTIPEGCELNFTGGKLENGTLVFDNTELNGNVYIRCAVQGSISTDTCHISWFADSGTKVAALMQVLFDSVKHIYIDKGIWYIDHLIQMRSGVTVEGVDKENSIFKVDGYSLDSLRGAYDMFATLDHWIYRWDYADNNVEKEEIDRQLNTILLSDVTFKNLSFDGNKISLGDADLIKEMHKSCICFVNSIRCNVINCSFKEDFTLSHNEGTHAIQYIYSQDSIVDNCQAASVSLVCMDYSNNIIVSNCKVNVGTDAIIETRGGRGHIIEHNTFIDKLWTSSFVGINSPYCIIRHNYFVCTGKASVETPLSMLTIGHEGGNVDASYTSAYDNTIVSEKQSRGIMVQSGIGVCINNNIINTKVVSSDIYDSWAGIQLWGNENTYNFSIINNTINAPEGIGISSSEKGGVNVINGNKITSRFGIKTGKGTSIIKDNHIESILLCANNKECDITMQNNTLVGREESPFSNNGSIVLTNQGSITMKSNTFINVPFIQIFQVSGHIINIQDNTIKNNGTSNYPRFIQMDGTRFTSDDINFIKIKNNIFSGYDAQVLFNGQTPAELKAMFYENKSTESQMVLQSTETIMSQVEKAKDKTIALMTDIECMGIMLNGKWISPDGYTLARRRGTSDQFPANLTSNDVGFVYFNTSDKQHYKAESVESDGTVKWGLLNTISYTKTGVRASSAVNQTTIKADIIRVSSNYTGSIGIYSINKSSNIVEFIAGLNGYGTDTKSMYVTYNSSGLVVNANEQAVNGSWVLYIEELL